jgi:hypothetical protein
VSVGVCVGVAVGDGVAVGVGVLVGEGEGVGVGVGAPVSMLMIVQLAKPPAGTTTAPPGQFAPKPNCVKEPMRICSDTT